MKTGIHDLALAAAVSDAASSKRLHRMRAIAASVLLTGAALAPPAVRAGDSDLDTGFASTEIQPGEKRLYHNADDERIVAAARAPDGGYVFAGWRAGGGAGAVIFLAKLRPNGTYDTGFGGLGGAGTGRVLKDAYLGSVADMTIDAQGRIVVVGSTPGLFGQSDYGVVRFKADGSDDTSFDGDGGTSVAFNLDATNGRISDVPASVTTTPDGSIFVAGIVDDRAYGNVATTRVGIVKLKPDGSVATNGFGTNGRAYYCAGQCENVLHVARIVYDAPRDRLVFGGDFQVAANDSDWFIATQTLNAPVFSLISSYVVEGDNDQKKWAFMKDLLVQRDGKPLAPIAR